mgnify:CR=1 FL=1
MRHPQRVPAFEESLSPHKYQCALLTIVGMLDSAAIDVLQSLSSDISDFEDAVMVETAKRASVDCIVTRNQKDYAKSPGNRYSCFVDEVIFCILFVSPVCENMKLYRDAESKGLCQVSCSRLRPRRISGIPHVLPWQKMWTVFLQLPEQAVRNRYSCFVDEFMF